MKAISNGLVPELQPVEYSDLTSFQKEQINYQHAAGLLARFGYICLPVVNDAHAADFIAYHVLRQRALQVQLKSRFTIDSKYKKRDLYMVFPANQHRKCWYFVPHDWLVEAAREANIGENNPIWKGTGRYTSMSVPQKLKEALVPYVLS